ncbi:MAG: 50S ribosomal protein L29 [Candidatus Pacebacteria bacterium]|nr:50S ribosomal protein L29 [Candidatus Paceibacterota bacterium]
MKIKEIEKKPEKERQQLLQEKRERLRQINFSIATGKVKNVREIRLIKRDIARILTVVDIKKEKQNQVKK